MKILSVFVGMTCIVVCTLYALMLVTEVEHEEVLVTHQIHFKKWVIT